MLRLYFWLLEDFSSSEDKFCHSGSELNMHLTSVNTFLGKPVSFYLIWYPRVLAWTVPDDRKYL